MSYPPGQRVRVIRDTLPFQPRRHIIGRDYVVIASERAMPGEVCLVDAGGDAFYVYADDVEAVQPASFTCPGCGRPTAIIFNGANCPACAGRD